MAASTPPSAALGVLGLGVMGGNLGRNAARRGTAVAGFDLDPDRRASWAKQATGDEVLIPTDSLAGLVERLDRPRRVLLMVPAGAPVDHALEELVLLLDRDDVVIDGGNSHPRDTDRRCRDLAGRGLHIVGLGVSGGARGALEGPSLMFGGSPEAWEQLRPLLEPMAAHSATGPCIARFGPGGAGHLVKTVHNGIEYADMQLLAEAFDLMLHVCGLDVPAIAEQFAAWNDGPLGSFLIETTARVLGARDERTGGPLVDAIVDAAGQKGTGRWTAELALELGVPVPTLAAAVQARGLSAERGLRRSVARTLGAAPPAATEPDLLSGLHDALRAARLCAFAQGFHLLTAAARAQDHTIDLGEVARTWTAGCILRGRVLDTLLAAYRRRPDLPHLLLDPDVAATFTDTERGLRLLAGTAVRAGVPCLALAGSLSYADSLRRTRLPQSLTQAQRDAFGSHGFERLDAEGIFHHDWDARAVGRAQRG